MFKCRGEIRDSWLSSQDSQHLLKFSERRTWRCSSELQVHLSRQEGPRPRFNDGGQTLPLLGLTTSKPTERSELRHRLQREIALHGPEKQRPLRVPGFLNLYFFSKHRHQGARSGLSLLSTRGHGPPPRLQDHAPVSPTKRMESANRLLREIAHHGPAQTTVDGRLTPFARRGLLVVM